MIELNVDGDKVAKGQDNVKQKDKEITEDPLRTKHVPFYQKLFPLVEPNEF